MMKKIVLTIICLAFIVVSNIYIFNYFTLGNNQNVQLDIKISSRQNIEYQLYYSEEEEFSENDSEKRISENGTVLFNLPSSSNLIRLDFGDMATTVKIEEILLRYDKYTQTIPLDLKKSIISDNMIEAYNYKDDYIELKTNGTDAYICLDITQWDIESFVESSLFGKELLFKFIWSSLLDLTLIAIFINYKKLLWYLKEIADNKKLIVTLAKNDFKTKYAGSYLGIIWAFVQPIVTVLIYWFVFQVGFRTQSIDQHPYVLWLIAGLIPWFFFSDSLNAAMNSMQDYSYLVKKVVFKISILPIVKMLSALYVHLFFLIVLIVIYACNGYMPGAYTLQIIYYSVCMIALNLGLSYLTCSVLVFFKDLGQIISIVLQVGMWMTPIMWQDTMIPQQFRWILKINPMYYVVSGYRDSLLYKIGFWEHIGETIYFWIVSLILFAIGITVFKKLKIHFADVL